MNKHKRLETIQLIDSNIRTLRKEATVQHSPGSDVTRIKIDRLEREREWIQTHPRTNQAPTS